MSIELRPLGVSCNLGCTYCYQNPQRQAGNVRQSYDLERMKEAVERLGGPATLFGGEPLLMQTDALEELLAWSYERFGSNTLQTNGALIEERYLDLFRRYNVRLGISIDGPGELDNAGNFLWHCHSHQRFRKCIQWPLMSWTHLSYLQFPARF